MKSLQKKIILTNESSRGEAVAFQTVSSTTSFDIPGLLGTTWKEAVYRTVRKRLGKIARQYYGGNYELVQTAFDSLYQEKKYQADFLYSTFDFFGQLLTPNARHYVINVTPQGLANRINDLASVSDLRRIDQILMNKSLYIPDEKNDRFMAIIRDDDLETSEISHIIGEKYPHHRVEYFTSDVHGETVHVYFLKPANFKDESRFSTELEEEISPFEDEDEKFDRYTKYVQDKEHRMDEQRMAADLSPPVTYEPFDSNVSSELDTSFFTKFMSRKTQKEPCTDFGRLMFQNDTPESLIKYIKKVFEESNGVHMTRVYREPYTGTLSTEHNHVYSIYLSGALKEENVAEIQHRIQTLLTLPTLDNMDLWLEGHLSFEEAVFAGQMVDLTHQYMSEDDKLFERIKDHKDFQDIKTQIDDLKFKKDRSMFRHSVLQRIVTKNPQIKSAVIKSLYTLFQKKFDPDQPGGNTLITDAEVGRFKADLESRFSGHQYIDVRAVFGETAELIHKMRATNFYLPQKRSFAFTLDGSVLDRSLYPKTPQAVHFVNGKYAFGSNMEMGDPEIVDPARGGMRLLAKRADSEVIKRIGLTRLNYALAATQDPKNAAVISTRGAKSVVVPYDRYLPGHHSQLQPYQTERAIFDFVDGLLDLAISSPRVTNYSPHHSPDHHKLFLLGPDEYITMELMDKIALHAKARGYDYWRALVTGKSGKLAGVSHRWYGHLITGEVFHYQRVVHKEDGVLHLLTIDQQHFTFTDINEVVQKLDGKIRSSGMTTTSVLAANDEILNDYFADPENQRKMKRNADGKMIIRTGVTGGTDGDVTGNTLKQLLGGHYDDREYQIPFIVDGSGVLYMPGSDECLSRDQLFRFAVEGVKTTADYDTSDGAIFIRRWNRRFSLQDMQGLIKLDSDVLQRELSALEKRGYLERDGHDYVITPAFQAEDDINNTLATGLNRVITESKLCNTIYAKTDILKALGLHIFSPGGGIQDEINDRNVHAFVGGLGEDFVGTAVGANLFFSEGAGKEMEAAGYRYVQAHDGNPGGVDCSHNIEATLALYLTDEDIEKYLVQNEGEIPTEERIAVIREELENIENLQRLRIRMFIDEAIVDRESREDATLRMSEVSERASEKILKTYNRLIRNDDLLKDPDLAKHILRLSISPAIQRVVSIDAIYERTQRDPNLTRYLNSQIAQFIAMLFVYRYGTRSEFNDAHLRNILRDIDEAESKQAILRPAA